MKTKTLIFLFVALFVFLSWSEGHSLCNTRNPLFRIERSKNENIVPYDACLLRNGNLSGSNPVDVYWILKTGKKGELNAVEKKYAYGIESNKKLGENRFRIVITALKDREIIIEKRSTDYKALVRINGEQSIIEKVYVKSEENFLGFPDIDYVDLFGRSLKTNQLVKERITPR
jgi:hypothetical protein